MGWLLTVLGRYADDADDGRRGGYLLARALSGDLVSWLQRDCDDDRFAAFGVGLR